MKSTLEGLDRLRKTHHIYLAILCSRDNREVRGGPNCATAAYGQQPLGSAHKIGGLSRTKLSDLRQNSAAAH
jgi:hypothetical protein